MTGTAMISPLLITKYNTPVPRYTSYPTVPNWHDEIDTVQWKQHFAHQFSEQNSVNGISIYVHLPFCESLCTYCGCNKKITTNHTVEEEYLAAVEKEWKMYRKVMVETPVLREIHLGGGTPTFFSAINLKRLINMLTKNCIVHPHYEFSIEGHPNNTSRQQLATLFSLGFRRISYGVQDLDPTVQYAINRHQPFERVVRATLDARDIGFTAVNFDLIYGLPFQTPESMGETIRQVMTLKPERIAFYSYAHVPWTSRGQRLFNESDLPAAPEKLQLYMLGRQMLLENGYTDIGMDHFALPHDNLYIAKKSGRLHRNFMGYTTQNTGLLIGLGVSAISDLGNGFAQNDKTVHNYYDLIHTGILPVKRGWFLSKEDVDFRQYIKDIACKGRTTFKPIHQTLLEAYCFPALQPLEEDGLVEFDKDHLQLTTTGQFFVRNVCSALDLYLQRTINPPNHQQYSKSI